MTKKETIQIFALVVAAYPAFDKFRTDEQVETMVNTWAVMFADDDAAVVALAVKRHIMTNKWPPSIAEVRDIMADITHPDLIPPDKAWEAVAALIYTEGPYMDESRLSFVLPELIANAVKAIGWHTLYELHRGGYAGNKDGMDRVAFLAQYQPAYERERLAATCSRSINAQIAQLRQQLSAGGTKMIAEAKDRRQQKDAETRRLQRRFYGELTGTSSSALPDPEDSDD